MAHLDIRLLEADLRAACTRKRADGQSPYIRIETGRYKPFATPTVGAARRRGHRVEKVCDGVFYVYPSSAMLAEVSGGAQK